MDAFKTLDAGGEENKAQITNIVGVMDSEYQEVYVKRPADPAKRFEVPSQCFSFFNLVVILYLGISRRK